VSDVTQLDKKRGPTEIPMLIGLPLLLLAAAVTVVVGPFVVVGQWLYERSLVRRLRRRGRYLPWSEVAANLESGRGSLILDQLNKSPARVWWTPEDIEGLAPAPPPVDVDLDYITGGEHPFARWCHERYLRLNEGSAFLTSADELSREPFVADHLSQEPFISVDAVMQRFPRAKAYAIVRVA
jgi:hypothetical protein